MVHHIANNWVNAELSEKHRALCGFAEKITSTPHKMNPSDLIPLKKHGLSDLAIHDAVQIIGYFNYINRVAYALGVMPESFTHSWELSVPYESSLKQHSNDK